MDNCDHDVEFILKKNNIYQQICNPYLQYEITVEKDEANQADRIFIDGDTIKMVKNTSAYFINEARLATTDGSDTQQNKNFGQFSTFM